jgi:hypothetical protein
VLGDKLPKIRFNYFNKKYVVSDTWNYIEEEDETTVLAKFWLSKNKK